jgi:hypothetical protein
VGVKNLIEIKEFVNGLIYRPAKEVFNEHKIATAYYSKSDMNTSVKWHVHCSSCPLTSFDRRGLCLSGFIQEKIFYETVRCNYLGSMSSESHTTDNLKVVIQCRWKDNKESYYRM